ncbi:hypothetical protein V5O48_011943, partial [Marasmius crinis-equi]
TPYGSLTRVYGSGSPDPSSTGASATVHLHGQSPEAVPVGLQSVIRDMEAEVVVDRPTPDERGLEEEAVLPQYRTQERENEKVVTSPPPSRAKAASEPMMEISKENILEETTSKVTFCSFIDTLGFNSTDTRGCHCRLPMRIQTKVPGATLVGLHTESLKKSGEDEEKKAVF